MPTPTQILDLAPAAAYLANNDVQKSTLFNNFARLNPLLPRQIFALYFILKKIHTLDPNYSGLTACCNYLWEIMGRYGVQAQGLSGGGGSVTPITPVQNYPIYITQAAFTTATFYPNANIYGTNIIIYYNEIQRYLIPTTEFTVSPTGVTITLGGFDSQFDCNLVIEKYYTT